MRLVPFRYTVRSLVVRWSPSLFSALGIGLTVAVLGGVLALREGFQSIVAETGADDVAVYLRPGAQSEGESIVRHPVDTNVLKPRPEVALDASGTPLAAAESYLDDMLDLTDGTMDGGEQKGVTLQATWQPLAFLKFQADWSHLDIERPNSPLSGTADAVTIRSQIEW